MPEVSVIIPTHDRAGPVCEAVESVLAQTYRDFELIVVDDGSTDETPAALAAFGDRLRVIRQENRGVSAARNAGIRATTSPWLAFLDSDDLWKPGKLDRQMRALAASPGAELCYTGEVWIRRGRRVNACKHHEKASGDLFARSLRLCLISPSSVVLRRRLFDEVGLFDEALPACEDYDLWLRITCRHPVLFLREGLIVKNGGHADQLSRRYWGMDRFRVRALEKLLDEGVLDDAQAREATGVLNEKCAILAGGCRKRGREEEALAWERRRRDPRPPEREVDPAP